MYGPRAVIHLDNLVHNYNVVKKHLGGRRLMTVVKADAYGHGAVECAKALKQAGSDYFAVYTVGEALELRNAGITDEILIFSRTDRDEIAAAVNNNLTLIISWKDDLDWFADHYRQTGRSPKLHLKIDTGMTRLGVAWQEVPALLQQIQSTPGIELEGMYSHFATADEGDPSYAKFQLDNFNACVAAAKKLEMAVKYVHFSNSGAVLNHPDAWFDLVRVGLLLYGAFPSSEVPQDLPIKPVMDYRASITTVRSVKAGIQISYGGVYAPPTDTTIGVIQCGFADGFPRPWFAMGHVMYKGRKFKIAGRVCMDQFMVNFAGEQPPVGDEVLIFGDDGENVIRTEEISVAIGLTPYTLLTAIHGRTRRVYIGE
ncbi:MAG: alanine racemase [Candidatus Neomarinimicrobiota bacterium]